MTAEQDNAHWMKNWQAMSRQYWDHWQELARNVPGVTPQAAAQPWQEGLDRFARQFGGAGAQSDLGERVLAGAKGYLGLLQSMLAASGNPQPGAGVGAWTDALRAGMNLPGMDPSLMNNPLARALREIGGQGAKGFDQMMADFAPRVAALGEEAKELLGLPAFGFLREHQEHYQKAAQALVDYQEQSARYQALILKANQAGFERFEAKLAEREEPGRQIDSVRALYDLWVDAAEEAYAEIALSPEFREVYGAMVNAQMRVRAQVQQEVERVGAELGMPTRSELNTIGQRLHELRRELRRGGQDGALAAEVAALRREVAALKAAQGGGEPRKAAPRAAAAPKQGKSSSTEAARAPRARARKA